MKKMTKAQAAAVAELLDTALERAAEPIPELDFTPEQWSQWFERLPSGEPTPAAPPAVMEGDVTSQKISIRMPTSLLRAYKVEAARRGMKYQGLMKLTLKNHAAAFGTRPHKQSDIA